MSLPPVEIATVDARAGEACEACGFTIAIEDGCYHHRKAKGMGGRARHLLDVAVNLIRIHHRCHGWIHAHPLVSRQHGWIVEDWREPAEVRVKINPSLYRWAA